MVCILCANSHSRGTGENGRGMETTIASVPLIKNCSEIQPTREEVMSRKRFHEIAFLSFALILIVDTASPAQTQDRQISYANRAPLEQSLMPDRGAERAREQTGPPGPIAREEGVRVWGPHG